jgi:hypothetical protein
MDKVFQKIIDNNFSNLKGLAVDAAILVVQHIKDEGLLPFPQAQV